MAPTDVVEDRNRIARIALAGVAALVAVRSLQQGKRKRGVLAALGAVALGYSARSDGDSGVAVDVEDDREVSGTDVSTETTTETEAATETEAETKSGLRCAACGEAIVPGQRRGPDENDRTVHEACLQAAA